MGDARRSETGGALVLVATPIGNLEDITLRALRALRACDAVLAEDTRRTRKLLQAHGIDTALERLDDHVVQARLEHVLARLRAGETLCLVTDAGTPLVSDPGAVLVRAALEAGLRVEALPGPSAVLAALLVSGIAGRGFRFVGFLPREGTERRAAIAAAARDALPTVLFESPERLAATLADLRDACGGERQAAVARELTKLHEETLRGTLDALCQRLATGVRGEVTVVLDGADQDPGAASVDALDAALDAAFAAGLRPSDAARDVARALGLRRAEVYARALERARAETAPDPDPSTPGARRTGA